MTIPIGGVWRPGDSDNEEETNFFFGDKKTTDNESNSIGHKLEHCFDIESIC